MQSESCRVPWGAQSKRSKKDSKNERTAVVRGSLRRVDQALLSFSRSLDEKREMLRCEWSLVSWVWGKDRKSLNKKK